MRRKHPYERIADSLKQADWELEDEADLALNYPETHQRQEKGVLHQQIKDAFGLLYRAYMAAPKRSPLASQLRKIVMDLNELAHSDYQIQTDSGERNED